VVRAAAPALIMAIAVFMILTQLGIATVIVVINNIALIGAVALGAALAFGLGGRDAADRFGMSQGPGQRRPGPFRRASRAPAILRSASSGVTMGRGR